MGELAPLGPVYQAGTLSGNPVATAAGLATLSLLDQGTYAALSEGVGRFAARLADALAGAGLAAQVPVLGPLLGVFFGARPVVDYEGARASAATGHYPGLMHGLLDRGIALAPGAYEVMFPSLAHGEDDFEVTAEAFAEAAADVLSGAPGATG
jgi:glutamate-1-semialdehyde 2,1-aminomutase